MWVGVRSVGRMDDLGRPILDLEARTFRRVGAKRTAVRALELTWNGYHRRLLELAVDPEAVNYRPEVCRRVRERTAA